VRSPAARCLLLALSSSAASSLLLGGRLHPIFRAEAGEKHQVLLLLQKNFINRRTDLPKRSTDLRVACLEGDDMKRDFFQTRIPVWHKLQTFWRFGTISRHFADSTDSTDFC
jgi:hypothetical protein